MGLVSELNYYSNIVRPDCVRILVRNAANNIEKLEVRDKAWLSAMPVCVHACSKTATKGDPRDGYYCCDEHAPPHWNNSDSDLPHAVLVRNR